ncbi:ABC1 kinase family protein [Cyanobacterium sp. uoEpiScrs1]|uniref:ABC1 kinase family protein n=1 Tax=Cyanobacterium sp. uoEpiScrs1 TaxID=2976343 RepID=UPI002269DA1E|nr:AarF/ABC1/UbiB kinase family protein [Cyanobacterium sp. uoEpiScrs1]
MNRRRLDIWCFVLILFTKFWLNGKKWSYRGGYSEEKRAARRQKDAVWIRENLLNLGPTFIKVGQLLSTRADLFPIEYIAELSKLQDEVPAFTYEQVAAILEEDFSKPLPELFHDFVPVPIAAASLGQVHKARLHSGEDVVVKVQRPGLKQLFTIDLVILKHIAHYFQNHPHWGKGRDWSGIYEECCRILWLEINYLNEGQNADTFRRNFRDEDWVKVPRVYWRYTSPRILTLEYLPGIKISHYKALEAAGLNRKILAKLGAKAYLSQLLNSGFFHADPHPGNIAVNTDGDLIFYDFGMMGRINVNIREKLIDILFGIIQKDAAIVVSSLVALDILNPADDMGPVRRSIQFMIDNFMEKPFEEQSVTQISDDLYALAYDKPFRFPAVFTFVVRALLTIEGVGKGLDSEFNFMEVAQPFAIKLMTDINKNTEVNIIDKLGQQALQVSNTALGLPRRINDTMDKLDRGDIRIGVRSDSTDRLLRRLSMMQMGTNYTILTSALVISAVILFVDGSFLLAIISAIIALVPARALFRLLFRLNRLDPMF